MWDWTVEGHGFRCWRFEQPEKMGSNITDQKHWHNFFHEMRFRKWDTQVQTASKTANNCKELWHMQEAPKRIQKDLKNYTNQQSSIFISMYLLSCQTSSYLPSGLLVPKIHGKKSCTNCSFSIETIHGEDESRTGTFMVPSLQSQHTIVINPITGFHSLAPKVEAYNLQPTGC